MLSIKEQVWRFVLEHAEDGLMRQQDIAADLGISVSTVHNALAVPRRSGAVEVGGRGFEVTDKKKFAIIWAVFRNLYRDVLVDVWSDLPPGKTEGLISRFEGVAFTGPSAFKFEYGYVPSDYDHVLAYAPPQLVDEIVEQSAANISGKFKSRVPRRSRYATRLTLLEPDPRMPDGKVPWAQVYADLWQLPEWWATEFTKRIEAALLDV